MYGMGGQTYGKHGPRPACKTGAGFSPEQMHAERVDGYNPLAVIDAMRRKTAYRRKKRPVLLDVLTYRVTGHFAVRRVKLPYTGGD